MSKTKVDLSLLKRLVSELEMTLSMAESVNEKSDKNGYVVEMSKAAGVAAGIMTEGGLLIGDIQHLIQGSPDNKASQDLLGKIMGGLKGPGTAN